MEAVPGGVLEEVVPAGAVVDEDHQRDADPAERVQRAQTLLLLQGGGNSIDISTNLSLIMFGVRNFNCLFPIILKLSIHKVTILDGKNLP